MKTRRMICVLLVVLTLCQLCAYAAWHDQVDYADMSYEHMDAEHFYELQGRVEALAGSGDNELMVVSLLRRMMAVLERVSTMSSIAYIEASADRSDAYWAAENAHCSLLEEELYGQYASTLKKAVSSPAGEGIAAELDSAELERILGSADGEQESLALYEEESRLLGEYYETVAKGFTARLDGKTVTETQLREMADEEGFEEAYTELFRVKCQTLGELYLRLVRVRVEIARRQGYASYAEMAYAGYGRAYAPEDAERLCELTAEYLAPLFAAVRQNVDMEGTRALMAADFNGRQMLESICALAGGRVPGLTESVGYMLGHGLYNIGAGETRYAGAYTTVIQEYNAPFLFLTESDGLCSAGALIHELGHYNAYYSREASQLAQDIDLEEVYSQGLEMLMTEYYPQLMNGLSDASLSYNMLDWLWAALSGCLYDEFQRRVFDDPNMTAEQLCDLYTELCGRYGVQQGYGWEPYEWADNGHLFESPFYNVSYAVSVMPAWELWADARAEGYEHAWGLYARLLEGGGGSLTSALEECGFADPFAGETVSSVAASIEAYLDGAGYQDTRGHWAEEYIDLMREYGLMEGTGNSLFQPDRELTRAELTAVLYRMTDEEPVRAAAIFDDVSGDESYCRYAQWAGAMGLVDGGSFRPDEPATRREMAVMVYRLLGALEYDVEGAAAEYADVQPGDESALAIGALSRIGVMQGDGDGSFRPESGATRAEFCAMAARLLEWAGSAGKKEQPAA